MLENHYSAYFNNMDLTDFFGIQRISGRDLGERDIETITIAGMRGAYLSRINAPVREIEIDAFFHVDSREELRKEIEALQSILETEEERELVFSDESDRIYYAVYAGGEAEEDSSDLPAGMMRGTLYFLCPDPDKYGQEREVNFENGYAVIDVEGSLPTDPKIKLEVEEDTTFVQLVKHTGEYIQVGNPNAVEDATMNPRPVVFEDGMDAIGDWSEVNALDPEGGTIAGSWNSDGFLFRPNDFGPEVEGWHGPTYRHELPRLLQNFYVEVAFSFKSYNAQNVGRLELYLIDSNDKIIGKLALKDNSVHSINTVAEIGIGPLENRQWITSNFSGYQSGSYAEFEGRLFIRRDGLSWWGQVGEQEGGIGSGGRYINRSSDERYLDVNEEYQAPLAALQIHAGQNKNHWTVDHMFIHKVRVRELNNPQEGEIPLLAEKGDTLLFDHMTGEVLRNGEDIKDLRDFGSSFFSLDKDENELYSFPENAFFGTVTYQNKYK